MQGGNKGVVIVGVEESNLAARARVAAARFARQISWRYGSALKFEIKTLQLYAKKKKAPGPLISISKEIRACQTPPGPKIDLKRQKRDNKDKGGKIS